MKFLPTLYKKLTFSLTLFALTFSAISCSEDEDAPAGASTVTLEFQNQFEGQTLTLGQEYTNAHGHRVKFNSFRYYISNVKLSRPDGTQYVQPDSYRLIERTDERIRESFDLLEVPAGAYTSLTFSIGVDPTRNHSTDQVGDLDPNHFMAWNWDTGYKFLVAEGQYFNTAEATFRNFIYHVGHDANYRTVTLNLPSGWKLNGQDKTLALTVNAKTLFGGPNVIDLSATGFSTIHGGANAALVADNFQQMFQVKQGQ
ncbi:MbnP family protein [Rufibacter roseus]|uniref:MbnP family protein n=1 Tax=Rufibacter roseus TaxID=1567108 RepID=A0ABW2DNC0_9BACT|nr:MbnP family protein [Rufibacter roseus]